MMCRSGWPNVALTVGVLLFVAAASARLTGASGVSEQPQRISFDCDPSQLHGALKVLCLAKRFEEGRRLFEEETFGGNGLYLCHLPQRPNGYILTG